jgi:hypothetical protein
VRETDPGRIHVIGAAENHGQRIMYDDMEGVLKWGSIIGWPSVAIRKMGAVVYGGNFAIQLYSLRDIPNGVIFGYMGRRIPGPRLGIFRAEVRMTSEIENPGISPPIVVTVGSALKVEWRDGTKRRITGIRFNRYDKTAELFDENLYDDVVGVFNGGDLGRVWHHLWFEYDTGNEKYVSAGIDGAVYAVGEHTAGIVDDSGPVQCNFLVGIGNWEVGKYYGYVDDAAMFMI